MTDSEAIERYYYQWHKRHMWRLKQQLSPELYAAIEKLWAPIWERHTATPEEINGP